MVKKPAMDAAIKAAELRATEAAKTNFRETREAERFVAPWVGTLGVACDSAEAVFKTACEALGIDIKGVHPSAYRSMIQMAQKPGAARHAPAVAMDSAAHDSFAKRYPGTERLRVV